MRLGGIASGLDTTGLLEQLMEFERRPIDRIEKDIENIESTKDAWRGVNKTLRSFMDVVDTLQDKDNYFSMAARASHEEVSVTAGNNADDLNYDLEVLQVARTHRIASGQIEFEDIEGLDVENEPLGLVRDNGNDEPLTLEIKMASHEESFVFEIDDEDSLADIRDKINSSELMDEEDERDMPVNATIIGGRLVLEAAETGKDNGIESVGGDEEVWGEEGLNLWDGTEGVFVNETQAAQNADYNINGIEFRDRQSNIIDEVIRDVTIDISQAGDLAEDEVVNIFISHNREQVMETMEQFVENFNETFGKLQEKGRVEITDRDNIDRGPLQGDTVLRNVIRNFRTRLTDPISTEGIDTDKNQLTAGIFGIDIDRYGEMSFDEERFTEALEEDPNEVFETFGGDNGIANRLYEYLETHSFAEGAREGEMRETAIGNRQLTLRGQVRRYEDRIMTLERRLEQREETMWRQFSQMEAAMSQIYSEGNWLSMQFAGMFNS